MNVELKCCVRNHAIKIFEIKGLKADINDFGKWFNSEKRICYDGLIFERDRINSFVLDKYKITKKEYSEICNFLEKSLLTFYLFLER